MIALLTHLGGHARLVVFIIVIFLIFAFLFTLVFEPGLFFSLHFRCWLWLCWTFAEKFKELQRLSLRQRAHLGLELGISPCLRLLIHLEITVDHQIDGVLEVRRARVGH